MKIKELVHSLEDDVGNIVSRIITLQDVKSELGVLRVDMDNLKKGTERIALINFHRKVRILDDLVSYTVSELEENYHQIQDTKDELFNKVVKGK